MPTAAATGAVKRLTTVTVVGCETAEVQPAALTALTEYAPETEGVKVAVVADCTTLPRYQMYVAPPLAVSETAQVLLPVTLMLGVLGKGVTVTETACETNEVQAPEIARTV